MGVGEGGGSSQVGRGGAGFSVHHHNEILRLLGSCGYWRRWWEFSGGYRKVPGGNEGLEKSFLWQ